jgi:hypothetical protein
MTEKICPESHTWNRLAILSVLWATIDKHKYGLVKFHVTGTAYSVNKPKGAP